MATLQAQETMMGVTYRNKTHRGMILYRSHVWSGPTNVFAVFLPVNMPPRTLPWQADKGSKAAAIYVGVNAAGVDCAWVFAWNQPPHSVPLPPQKVFVMCGSKERIDGLSFDEIEKLLENSKSSATFADLATKTSADAKFDNSVSDFIDVLTNFNLIP